MTHYRSNLRDIEFNLFEVFGSADNMGKGPFAEMDADTAREILSEVDRLASGPLAEPFADNDRMPPVFDPATYSVTMPESFTKAFNALRITSGGGSIFPNTSVAPVHRPPCAGQQLNSSWAPTRPPTCS